MIQEDCSRRNNTRVNGIEDENETREDTENKLWSLLYDELEINDELYIERAHHVRRTECINANSNDTPRTIETKYSRMDKVKFVEDSL